MHYDRKEDLGIVSANVLDALRVHERTSTVRYFISFIVRPLFGLISLDNNMIVDLVVLQYNYRT
jgi:hypothetical protein